MYVVIVHCTKFYKQSVFFSYIYVCIIVSHKHIKLHPNTHTHTVRFCESFKVKQEERSLMNIFSQSFFYSYLKFSQPFDFCNTFRTLCYRSSNFISKETIHSRNILMFCRLNILKYPNIRSPNVSIDGSVLERILHIKDVCVPCCHQFRRK